VPRVSHRHQRRRLHHEALIKCQDLRSRNPTGLFVVSEHWRDLLRNEYGVEPVSCPNGVDFARFAGTVGEQLAAPSYARAQELRDQFCSCRSGGITSPQGQHGPIARG